MTREARLASAAATGWVEHYSGKNIIQGYARWFGVDLIGAITELRMLGLKIDEARENQVKASVETWAELVEGAGNWR